MSQPFASGGQSIGASATVLPMNSGLVFNSVFKLSNNLKSLVVLN